LVSAVHKFSRSAACNFEINAQKRIVHSSMQPVRLSFLISPVYRLRRLKRPSSEDAWTLRGNTLYFMSICRLN
jgi:hypothetical protein